MQDQSLLGVVGPIDYIIIGAYLAALIWIGKFFSSYNRDIKDIFKGGGKLPWWVGGISSFMAAFSAIMFTGGAGVIYELGPAGIPALCTSLSGAFVGYLFFARRWRRARVTSMFEYVSTRFNLPTQQAMSWLYIPMNLFYASNVLLATSIFFSAAVGLDAVTLKLPGMADGLRIGAVPLAILVAGAVILFYCYFGGLLAVTSCDVLSFLVIIPVAVLIVPLIVLKLPEPSLLLQAPVNFVAPAADRSVLGEPITPFFLALWLVSAIHGMNTNPVVQRYWSVRDEKAARKVALLTTLLLACGVVVWSVPPMAVRHLFPDLSAVWTNLNAPAEGAYVSACLAVLPKGLVGVMFAAIFAASMSSIDSVFNFLSGIFTNDIYRKTIKRNATPQQLLRAGRLSTLVIGLIAIGLALAMSVRGGAFSWMVLVDRIFTTPIVVPLLMGLLFPRRGSRAAMAAFLVGLIFNLSVTLLLELEYGVMMFTSFLLTYTTFVITAFLLPDGSEKKAEIDRFFRKLDTPVEAESELEEAAVDRLSMLKFIGKLAVGAGLCICALVVIGQPLAERLKVLSGGAVVLSLGLFMLWVERRSSRLS